jgi:hypothetical protein
VFNTSTQRYGRQDDGEGPVWVSGARNTFGKKQKAGKIALFTPALCCDLRVA